jgi:hypothetical protein
MITICNFRVPDYLLVDERTVKPLLIKGLHKMNERGITTTHYTGVADYIREETHNTDNKEFREEARLLADYLEEDLKDIVPEGHLVAVTITKYAIDLHLFNKTLSVPNHGIVPFLKSLSAGAHRVTFRGKHAALVKFVKESGVKCFVMSHHDAYILNIIAETRADDAETKADAETTATTETEPKASEQMQPAPQTWAKRLATSVATSVATPQKPTREVAPDAPQKASKEEYPPLTPVALPQSWADTVEEIKAPSVGVSDTITTSSGGVKAGAGEATKMPSMGKFKIIAYLCNSVGELEPIWGTSVVGLSGFTTMGRHLSEQGVMVPVVSPPLPPV